MPSFDSGATCSSCFDHHDSTQRWEIRRMLQGPMTTDFSALSTCLLLKIQVGIQLPLQEGECAGLLASIVKQWGIRACGYHFIWGGRAISSSRGSNPSHFDSPPKGPHKFSPWNPRAPRNTTRRSQKRVSMKKSKPLILEGIQLFRRHLSSPRRKKEGFGARSTFGSFPSLL